MYAPDSPPHKFEPERLPYELKLRICQHLLAEHDNDNLQNLLAATWGSQVWNKAIRECLVYTYEAYYELSREKVSSFAGANPKHIKEIKLSRFSKARVEGTVAPDAATSQDSPDGIFYSLCAQPNEFFATISEYLPMVRAMSFWLISNIPELVRGIGTHCPYVTTMDFEYTTHAENDEQEPDFGPRLARAFADLPNQLTSLTLLCWYPTSEFMDTLARHQPQLEHLKTYAQLDTFASPVCHPGLKSLEIPSVLVPATFDPSTDHLCITSSRFPNLEKLHISYIAYMSREFPMPTTNNDILSPIFSSVSRPWSHVVSLKLPQFTDAMAVKLAFKFPRLSYIYSEFAGVKCYPLVSDPLVTGVIGQTREQLFESSVLSYRGFLALVQSLPDLRVISLGSNYYNSLHCIDDQIAVSKVPHPQHGSSDHEYHHHNYYYYPSPPESKSTVAAKGTTRRPGDPAAAGIHSDTRSIEVGDDGGLDSSDDDSSTLLGTPMTVDYNSEANLPFYETIPWACTKLKFLKIASAPVSLPAMIRILRQLPYLQHLNLNLFKPLKRHDFVTTCYDYPEVNSSNGIEQQAAIGRQTSVHCFPSVYSLCIKLSSSKHFELTCWALLFAMFPSLQKVTFEPKQFELSSVLRREFTHIAFDDHLY